MAEQTVSDNAEQFGLNDAFVALRKTSQAMAIMRAVSLAVAAQEDGSVCYDNNTFSRWQPAIDAARDRVHTVRDALLNKSKVPDQVDWWTSLTILDAAGAALWYADGVSARVDAMSSEELQSIADAAINTLGEMFEELSTVANALEKEATQGTAVG
jgi:hypothetical protein